jgi:hypothetical protein
MKIYGPQITGSLGINGSTIGNFNNLVSTSSFNQYTSSVTTGSLATTGSNTFVGNQNISGTVYLTGSIIPTTTNTYDLGDSTHQFRHLYLSSGSLYINGTKVIGATGQELQITSDAGQSIKILEAGSDTITLQSADGNITLATSGNGDVILDPTSGIIALKGTTTLYAGNTVLSSDCNAIQFGNDLGITGSIVTTGNVNGVNVLSLSSSVASAVPNLNNATSSIQSFTSSINTRVNNLENADLTFATTGSNTFKGNQIVSASMYVTGDLVVYGTSSIQNISASIVSIGTNIVQLNTATPAVRFAGLQVIDSGSTAMSASLFWDSVNNHWIYQRESGAVYGGGMLISGPRNLGALGDEIGITNNKLVVGNGGDHISSSQIYHDSTTTSFPNNVEITGSATIATLNAGNGIVSGSTQIKNLLPDGSVSGSEQVVGILSSLNSATSSYETKGRGIVSGSSQITFSGISSLPTLVSGSSQITMASTTGFGTYINQAVLTTSSPTFASVTGTITQSGNGDSNAPFRFSADYSGWMSNVAGTPGNNDGWGIFWAGNSGARYGTNGTGGPGDIWSNSSNPNEYVFVGQGQTNMSIHGNTGNVWIGGQLRVKGDLLPNANNSYNLGSASLGWANIYTNDLHLSNEGKTEGNDIDGTTGNWTIQEGAEHLYIINNKTGKKFKFSLEEIQ